MRQVFPPAVLPRCTGCGGVTTWRGVTLCRHRRWVKVMRGEKWIKLMTIERCWYATGALHVQDERADR